MMNNNQIYIDGTYYNRDEAKISVYDHGLLYGDGIFEGIRIYSGKVFKLKEHIDRLFESAKAIHLSISMNKEELTEEVLRAVQKNKKSEGYIRLIVTRGVGDLGLDPFLCEKATVIIIVDDIKLYPDELYKKGIAIITASTRRVGRESIDPRIKSLNYLNNILAKIEAKQNGCLEALMLNNEGYVTECTGDNIFLVKNGTLYTPHPSAGILKGITRDTILELAEALSIPWEETTLTIFDCYSADECFLTGSGAEVIPVVSIDGREIGIGKPGIVTDKLRNEFRKYISTP